MNIDNNPRGSIGNNFSIEIRQNGEDERSDKWQSQCSLLYSTIKKNLPEGRLQPIEYESSKDEKAELITIFSTLVATGITSKAFEKLFDIIKIWNDNRPKAKITLKYPDGSTLELSGLSKSDALKLMESRAN